MTPHAPATSAETLNAVHSRVLESIATGTPLDETLDELIRVVEATSGEGLLASILLLDEDGLHLRHGSAPSLPEEYSRQIDGMQIGAVAGSCGTAAYHARPVLVSDIEHDPLWAEYRHLALPHGLRACWSTPILGSDGAVIGTFANYYRQPRDASPHDQELTRLITRTAGIAIEHERRRLRLDREMARLQRIYTLTDMLGRASSLAEIYEEAMSAVQDLLRVRRVSILLFDDDQVMRFQAWRGLSDEYCRAVEGHTPWTPDDVDAAPIVVPDVFADPGLARYADLFRREAIGGLAFIPLRTRNVLGKFMAYFDEPRALSQDEVRVAETIAHHMAFAVERTRREEKLHRTGAILGAIFDQTSDAVLVKDREGRYVMVNAAAARVAGLEPSQMIGKTVRDVAPSLIAEEVMQHDEEIMASGTTRVLEEPVRNGNGNLTFLSTKGPWRDGDGNVIGLIGISRDITERKREIEAVESLARENAALYAEAREASRAKDEFLATLSHELRTPMTSILGWTRLLQLGDLDEGATRLALESIDGSTRAQAQIVEDILDVSRIITGKMAIEQKRIEVDGIVRAAVDAIRPAAEAKRIDLGLTLSGARRKISGDPNRLRQVAWNLLANAIKFTPDGGTVQVRLAYGSGAVAISVTDSGEGIAPALLPHVFERFRQGDSSSTRVHGGLGLGLAIVRHLVELHGGTVAAASDGPGKGATFTVKLPLAAQRDAPAGRTRKNSLGRLPSLRRKRILVVDDEEQTRTFLSALLVQCGADVRSTASAAEAVSMAESWIPHVVVSDLAMPHEDGFSLIARLRVADRRPRFSAIALTAYARPEDRDRALAAGFDQFLQKPVEPLELASAIAATTKERRRVRR